MNIGFIGLGNMGSGMAQHVLAYCRQHGHTFFVLDLDRGVVEDFVTHGAVDGVNVGKLSRQVDVLFTSLPTAKEINDVALGQAGVLQNLPMGAVWFETSTNDLAEWQQVRQQAPDSVTLVDAPVTGGAEGAAAGSLTMLLGVDDAVLQAHADLLASFTSRAVRMGPSGAGYVAKLCQLHLNYLVAQGLGEALMLGAKAQLDLGVLHSVLKTSCAQSYVVDTYVPKVLDGSYDPSFTLGLATKDMCLITELGKFLDVPLPLADEVYSDYQVATEKYGANQPHLKIVKLIEDQTNLLLRNS